MIKALLVVLVLPTAAYAMSNIFHDVQSGQWFSPYVQEAADLGIVSGYKDASGNLTGLFKPSNNVTLAEVLKMATEAAGYDYNDYPTLPWDSGHWVMPYYRIAHQEGFGIFVGATENVDKSATRTEVASIIIDAFLPAKRVELMNADYKNPYRDIQVTNTFQDGSTSWGWNGFILKLTEDGIFSGDKDASGNFSGYFRPNDSINRAEVVKTIMAARKAYGQPGVDRKQIHHVLYRDRGFLYSPTIKVGSEVIFENNTVFDMWIASDPHPTHALYPEFDARSGISTGKSWSFVFTKPGVWTYHNHLKPEHTGVITVEK